MIRYELLPKEKERKEIKFMRSLADTTQLR
jgi:hypothetical protein